MVEEVTPLFRSTLLTGGEKKFERDSKKSCLDGMKPSHNLWTLKSYWNVRLENLKSNFWTKTHVNHWCYCKPKIFLSDIFFCCMGVAEEEGKLGKARGGETFEASILKTCFSCRRTNWPHFLNDGQISEHKNAWVAHLFFADGGGFPSENSIIKNVKRISENITFRIHRSKTKRAYDL